MTTLWTLFVAACLSIAAVVLFVYAVIHVGRWKARTTVAVWATIVTTLAVAAPMTAHALEVALA